MPGHVRDRPQTDDVEPSEPGQLLEVCLGDERDDRGSLSQAESIGQAEQPREIRVVEGDDDASAPPQMRPDDFKQALDVRGVVEISVEEDHINGIRVARYRPEGPGFSGLFARRVDGVKEHPRVARQRVDVDDAIGVASDPGDFPPDQAVGPSPQVPGKCETQTANASIQMITTCGSRSSFNDTGQRFSADRNMRAV